MTIVPADPIMRWIENASELLADAWTPEFQTTLSGDEPEARALADELHAIMVPGLLSRPVRLGSVPT